MNVEYISAPECEDIKIITVDKKFDKRGYYSEFLNGDILSPIISRPCFSAMAESLSSENVFRGLHFQSSSSPLEKIVRCRDGRVIDFALDVRVGSPTQNRIFCFELKDDDIIKMIYIPHGFAHGFITLEESIIEYAIIGNYNPKEERTISIYDKNIIEQLNDDILQILQHKSLILSEKDRNGIDLSEYYTKEEKEKLFYYNKSLKF